MPWRLVFKNLTKHWFRSLLTVGSLVIALFLLCTLRTLVVALDAGVRDAAANRLIVQSQVSLFVALPKSYQSKIREVPGVDQVSRWQWFGGYYQEQGNFFAQFGTDVDVFLEMYPEIEVIEGSIEKFKTERQACLVGTDLVDRFGWKVGDRVPIITGLFSRSDLEPWTFDVVGVYRSSKKNVDNGTLYFNFEYLAKALETGETIGPDGVGVYVATLKPDADRTQVAATIDGLFENGPQRTLTNTEAEFQAQFVSMMGNVPFFVSAIGMGVLIAILFATLNTMLMASGEQTRDLGVLKALGFTDSSVFALMLAQSLVLCSIGGFGGIGFAILTEPLMLAFLGKMFPGYELTTQTLLLATSLTLGLGLLAGILPALRARRLEVVEALRANV
jgi:putative ABC transport system permease protein